MPGRLVRRRRPLLRRKKRVAKKLTSVAVDKIKRLTYKCNVFTLSLSPLGYLNPANPAGNLNNAGIISHLSAVSQGNDYPNRRGNAIEPRLLRINAFVSLNDNTAGASGFAMYRILVIQGARLAGAVPAFADIFEESSTNQLQLMSWYNNDMVKMKVDTRNNDKPYKILYDSGARQIINANGTTIAGLVYAKHPAMVHHRITIPGRRMRQVEYNGTAGTNYLNTPIFLFAFTDVNGAGHNPVYGFTSQLYFDNVV